MKAQELRIGNYVWDDYSGEMIVTALMLHEKTIHDGVELRKRFDLPSGLYSLNLIQPINLTEDWLLKFGWEWDIFYQGYFGHNYTMFPNNETGWRISYCKRKHDIIVENIQFVHQLQNLYFALTGQELELK